MRWPLAIAASGALVLALGIWLAREGDAPAPPPAPPAAEPGPSARSAPEPRLVDPSLGRPSLASGEVIAIAAADLPGQGALTVELEVPPPSEGVEGLAARVVAPDSTTFESTAPLASPGRDRVRLEVPADWLRRPGKYIVEVKTTERTPLPLRRYAIVIR